MFPYAVAILAPTVSCLQFIPQLWKMHTTKNVKDISFYSLLLLLFSNMLWLAHGIFIMDLSIIVADLVGLIVNITVIILFFIHRKKHHPII